MFSVLCRLRKELMKSQLDLNQDKLNKLEGELCRFLDIWPLEQFTEFMRCVHNLMEMYDITDENNWIEKIVAPEDMRNVVLIRTAYLMSKIAEKFASKLYQTASKLPKFCHRLEKIKDETHTQKFLEGVTTWN